MQIKAETRQFLDELYYRYNCIEFIEDDPISVPHKFAGSQDREIGGFLAATIAWGNRKIIVRNAHRMMSLMDDSPYDFIMNASVEDLRGLEGFVHRTFNATDLRYFVLSLRNIYENHGGLGGFFKANYVATGDMRVVLSRFYKLFFELEVESRTTRHISNIDKGAACKRLCMYLKWMVRKDNSGVDLGLWSDSIPSSALYLPLDVHCGNVARELGLLERRQNDWRAVEQVTASLRELDAADPVKYDFALFCAGIDGLLKK